MKWSVAHITRPIPTLEQPQAAHAAGVLKPPTASLSPSHKSPYSSSRITMFRSMQFESDKGLGRVALAAFGLGFAMALHGALLAYAYFVPLSQTRVSASALAGGQDDPETAAALLRVARWECVALWSLYMVALCFFHVSEFMVTASFRPTIVSYECTSLLYLYSIYMCVSSD